MSMEIDEEEMARLIRADEEAARRDHALFKDFADSPQWKRISELLEHYIKGAEQSVVYDDEPHHLRNIKRGICKGMLTIQNLPRLLLADAILTIEQSEKQDEPDYDE